MALQLLGHVSNSNAPRLTATRGAPARQPLGPLSSWPFRWKAITHRRKNKTTPRQTPHLIHPQPTTGTPPEPTSPATPPAMDSSRRHTRDKHTNPHPSRTGDKLTGGVGVFFPFWYVPTRKRTALATDGRVESAFAPRADRYFGEPPNFLHDQELSRSRHRNCPGSRQNPHRRIVASVGHRLQRRRSGYCHASGQALGTLHRRASRQIFSRPCHRRRGGHRA